MALSKEKARPRTPPLTLDNLLPLFTRVHNLWSDEDKDGRDVLQTESLLSLLGLPESKQRQFRIQSATETEALSKAIKWWLQFAASVSWRRLILTLDMARETEVADGIRKYAEPLTDPTLTEENVRRVMQFTKNWKNVGKQLLVPKAILERLSGKEGRLYGKRLFGLVNYIVNTLPALTWKGIVSALQHCNERVQLCDHIPAAPPLTVECLMPLIKDVRNWWKYDRVGETHEYGLIHLLGIRDSECPCLRSHNIEMIIDWWLKNSDNVSWRKVVHSLDMANETRVADGIRKYAEPPTDQTLTKENVEKVLQLVKSMWDVGEQLLVPYAILQRSVEFKTLSMASYIVTTLPSITWEDIAAKLYSCDEEMAVQQAVVYVETVAEPSFTAANVMEVVKQVDYKLAEILEVPTSVWSETLYLRDDPCREAMIAHAVQTHPCLTWRRLSRNLLDCGEHEAATVAMIHMYTHMKVTLEDITQPMKAVRNWRWESRMHPGLLTLLGVPVSKQQFFRERWGYDENKVLSECIQWWLDHGTHVSWRDLIFCLDQAGETQVAHRIRRCAEPLADPTFNEENVGRVVKEMEQGVGSKAYGRPLGKYLSTPRYLIATFPRITWEDIASELYFLDEQRAMERAVAHINTVSDSTLTTANVKEMVRGISLYEYCHVFDISWDALNRIIRQHQSEDQKLEAALSHTLHTHPCLSWDRLSKKLTCRGYTRKAAEVTRKYVKADVSSLFSLCVNHIAADYEVYHPLLPKLIPHHVQVHIRHKWKKTYGQRV